MKTQWILCAVVGGLLAGCDQANSLVQPNAAAGTADAEAPSTDAQSKDEQASQPVEVELVEAEAGVGKRGQGLNQPHVNKTITAPANALFHVEQKLEFLKVTHAVNLYKATNGQVPQSHEQFMKDIVEANRIQLPELPAGQKYIWDPKQEKLMVERPEE